jgi:methoxymalonate biosynthesis acyl carrier protein
MEHIRDKIRNFLSKYIGNRQLDDNTEIFRSGYVNSLFAMQLVMFIEKEFDLRFEGNDLGLENFKSIAAIDNLIAAKTGHKEISTAAAGSE